MIKLHDFDIASSTTASVTSKLISILLVLSATLPTCSPIGSQSYASCLGAHSSNLLKTSLCVTIVKEHPPLSNLFFSLFRQAFLYLSLLLALFVCESALSEEVLAATFPKITLVVLEIEKVQNKTLFHHDKNKDLLQIV